jgi:hypothetical protein
MALKFHSGDSSLSGEGVQIRTVSMPGNGAVAGYNRLERVLESFGAKRLKEYSRKLSEDPHRSADLERIATIATLWM